MADDTTTARLLLACGAAVSLDDGRSVPLGPREALMLAWLAIEGPTPRLRLARLLWPHSPPEAARNVLRQRLFRLKRQGPDLVEGQATLMLAPGVVHDLEDSDDVLPGVDGEAEGELAEWLVQQRQRRRARLRQSLADLADMAEASRDWGDALAHARELLAIEPLGEDVHRRLMRLHYLAGDRAAALTAFDTCERVLKDEIGARPSEATLALLRTISASGAAQVPVSQALPAAMIRPPRLVGRDVEQRALGAAWHAQQVAWVVGEAGLGKSRLLQEALAARRGVAVAAARPGDATVPYSGLARLLRAVVEQAPGALADPPRRELARLLPDIVTVEAVHVAGSPAAPGPSGSAAGQRLGLQRSVVGLLRAAQAAGLQGLALDDLHFADAATLEMLAVLIDAQTLPGLRWAVATRPAEGDPGVRALYDALLEQQRLHPVELVPLDVAQMGELLDGLGLDVAQGIDLPALAATLHRHTGGNPLFALETLRQAWSEDGLRKVCSTPLPRPVNVARLIERRVGRLSASAVRLARCAALAAPDFSIDLATQVMGVPPLDMADAWAELESAQVLHDGAFAHDLIHEVVLASVPAPIARHLHGQIAAFLAARDAEPARLARHWAQARAWPQAAACFLSAAERARHGARIADCVALLEEAGRCAASAGDAATQVEALLQRARVLASFDFGPDCAQALDALDAAAATPLARLQAQQVRLTMHVKRGEHAQVLEQAPTARQAAQSLGRMDIEIAVAIDWAGALCAVRRAAQAVDRLEPYVGHVAQHGDADLQFDFWMALALARDYADRLRDAILAWDTVLAVPGLSGRDDLVWRVLADRAGTLAKLGQVQAAARDGEQALRAARSAGELPPTATARAEMVLAHRLRDLGRYAEALALLDQAMRGLGAEPIDGDRAAIEHRLAVLYQQLGQPERALPLLREERQGLHPGLAMMRLVHRADIARAMGGDGAVAMHEALAIIPDPNDIYHRIATLFATWLVPPDEGEALGASLAVWAGARERFGVALAGHVRAAACGLQLGAPSRALPHAEAALRLSREHQPDTFYLAEMWLVAARVYESCGRHEEARVALADGRTWVMERHARHVPEPFRPSFLQRNPVNRDLIALAARLSAP